MDVTHNAFRHATIVATLAVGCFTASLDARLTPLAVTGDDAPNAAGTPDGLFDELMRPAINQHGQVAFATTLSGTSSGAFNNSGYYRTSEAGPIVQIARENDPVPTSGVLSEVEAPQTVTINNLGQVVFTTRLAGVSTAENTAIYIGSGGGLTQIARELLTPAPGVGGGTVGDLIAGVGGLPIPQLNNAGQVAFYNTNIGGASTDTDKALFRGSGGDLTMLAREGNEITRPSGFGIHTVTTLRSLGTLEFGFNDLGQASFIPDFVDSAFSRARLFRSGGPNRGEVLIRGEQTTLESGLEIDDFTGVVANNNSGFVAAVAESTSSGDIQAVLMTDRPLSGVGESDEDFVLAQNGDTLPGSGVTFNNQFFLIFDPDQIAVNAANQVAFQFFSLQNTVDPGRDNQALLRAEIGNELTVLARQGQPVPGGSGVFDSFSQNDHGLALNRHGVVLFDVDLRETAGGTADDQGLYLSDGIEQFEVVREGAPLNGSTVVSFAAALKGSGGDDSEATSLNDFGQVAYSATLASGASGVFLFTPEIDWRSDAGGDWDDRANWTLSLAPGNPHDVTIDPDFSLAVNGPTTPTTVRSLTLGGDGSTATLILQGNNLTSTNTVQILDNAVLTGDGTLNGDAENHGTVIPDKLTINGTLTNHSLITGDGTLDGDIVNAAGGTVRALDNHINFPSGLTNQPGGLIAARDSLLDFGAGLTSSGNLTVSFGTSDIFGDITNNASGRIIASGSANVVFYDGLTNNGNVQVSAGSTAVYFGDVDGTGSYTGGGTNFFEADFSPGASPGTSSFGGDVVFGPFADVMIEAQATTTAPIPGTDNDYLDITGNVTFDGTLNILPTPDAGPIEDTPLGNEYVVVTYATRTPNSYWHTITGSLINTVFALAPILDNAAGTLTLRATIPGDLNLDNTVSVADLSTFALNFGTTPGLYDETAMLSSWQLGDFNADGAVTVADLSLLALNFGFDASDPTSGSPLSLTDAARLAGIDPSLIPEPTTIATFAVIVTLSTTRRRIGAQP